MHAPQRGQIQKAGLCSLLGIYSFSTKMISKAKPQKDNLCCGIGLQINISGAALSKIPDTTYACGQGKASRKV